MGRPSLLTIGLESDPAGGVAITGAAVPIPHP
jgi:hypothetical protein